MQRTLEEKIADIKKTLQSKCVDELAQFDVKNGEEDGNPYHRAYLDKTKADMGALFKKDAWAKLNPWEKLCCYKISGSKGVDCDAALRSTVIYQMVFGGGDIAQHNGIYRINRNNFVLRGDTMNSYATTVHEFLRTYGHEEDRVAGFLVKVGNVWGTRNLADANWEVCILENYNYFSKIMPPDAPKFFRLYHTVGNFIPWPDGCNVPRGSGPIKDYWDLTLNCIYQWYQDNKDFAMPQNNSLLSLFCSQMVVFQHWLASFGSWDQFVRENYMQDFVYGEGDKEGTEVPADGHYGPPKELWDDHFEKGVIPKEKADFEQFFTHASNWIKNRGKLIAEKVKAEATP